MDFDEIYDEERVIEISEQFEFMEKLNREAIRMALECQDIILIHKKIKQYTEEESFKLKGNSHSRKVSKRVQNCLKEIIKSSNRYLKEDYHLLARIILIRERSKVGLQRCRWCESIKQRILKCPMLEALADLNFDDQLKTASFDTEKKKKRG